MLHKQGTAVCLGHQTSPNPVNCSLIHHVTVMSCSTAAWKRNGMLRIVTPLRGFGNNHISSFCFLADPHFSQILTYV